MQRKDCIYTNRELSWLSFNERVLEEAECTGVPLFERLKFLAIYQSNLDEFFMVRVGSLHDQILIHQKLLDSKTGMTAQQQLDEIYARVKELLPRFGKCSKTVRKLLSREKIEHLSISKLTKQDHIYLKAYFHRELLPLVSPQIIDKRHPFPFLRNKERYVGVRIATKGNGIRLGIIPAAGYFKRFVFLPSEQGAIRFLLVEDVLEFYAEKVFSQYEVVEKCLFRVTRNADIEVEDELNDIDFDYRDAMEELLKKRRKLAPVRLELSHAVSVSFSAYFCKNLSLKDAEVFLNPAPLDLSFVWALEAKVNRRKELFYSSFVPQMTAQIDRKRNMIDQILAKDVLLHYPYHSMKPFLSLLNEAAFDDEVVSIKITLYRVAKDSKVISALIDAAENGKDVHVMVELRARFDEENNIDWSRRLEEAGCQVMYGLPGYKVHSKLLLITRKHGDTIQYITQIGTGNYNETSSRLYTDLSLLTADRNIAADAAAVFNSLFMGTTAPPMNLLLVAPLHFKSRIVSFIDHEIAVAKQGGRARIYLKMNSLTDRKLIDKLAEAAAAGVEIKMIIRGICCLNPGVPGKTDNIEVISIVGRFLEHSRVFLFGEGERERIYLSSADFMTRNTSRRIEVAAPVLEPALKVQVRQMFDIIFRDTDKARKLAPDGTYARVTSDREPFDSQRYFCELAEKEAQQTKKTVHPAEGLSAADDTASESPAAPLPRSLGRRLLGRWLRSLIGDEKE